MPVFKPVFSQIVSGLHGQAFGRCVEQSPMRRGSRRFSAYDHFLALCFGQLTYYPAALRRIRFRDHEQNRSFVCLANHFELPALVMCELYKRRWQVELFFKWIKQHLRIRRFLGRSPNAIYCQIWTAICTYPPRRPSIQAARSRK